MTEYSFIQDFQDAIDIEEEKKGEPRVDPNEFKGWDFHPYEADPPQSFVFSTYLESVRTSCSNFMRKNPKYV